MVNPSKSFLFQIYSAITMQSQFLPGTVDLLYKIETLYKLDHTFLKINQASNLFIKPYCKSKNKINSMKQYLIT